MMAVKGRAWSRRSVLVAKLAAVRVERRKLAARLRAVRGTVRAWRVMQGRAWTLADRERALRAKLRGGVLCRECRRFVKGGK